ncbi:MAG: ABC transporter substrate-binding protein [Acidiferrobacterales bacterium]|nr:ABC transporter substrate-binding protein [Acidiferrobacterales bacterium]
MYFVKRLRSILVAAFALMSIHGIANAEPIKIALNEWTGQHISAHFAANLFRELGHEVELITAGAVPQLAAIAEGSLHFQPETWTNNVGDIYPKAVESGDIIVLGGLGISPQEGWIYPPYMEERCPGLPSYEALYDCANAFAAADTFPNGRLITYPADWGTRSSDLVKLIELPLKPIPGGSEGAMVAELKSALAAEQPILLMFWEPHWVFAEIDMNWVQWDTEHGACDEGSQQRGSACGFQQATVDKIISKSFGEKFPAALKVAEQMTLTNAVQNELIYEVDQNNRPIEEVMSEWMAANESMWRPWIEAAM